RCATGLTRRLLASTLLSPAQLPSS
ncbi:hypothetical protein AZZ62_004638, partial [Klebsiella variicola]